MAFNVYSTMAFYNIFMPPCMECVVSLCTVHAMELELGLPLKMQYMGIWIMCLYKYKSPVFWSVCVVRKCVL